MWYVSDLFNVSKRIVFYCLLTISFFGCSNVITELTGVVTKSTPSFDPVSSPSNDPSPTIVLRSIKFDQLVTLHLNSDCSDDSIASGTSGLTGEIIMNPDPFTTEGSYKIFAGYEGKCSGVYLEYEYDKTSPLLSGVSDDYTPVSSKTFSWSCSEVCSYRWLVDRISNTQPSGAFGTDTSMTHDSGDGTFYIHVEAKDLAGNTSISHARFELDNTLPSPPSALSLVTPTASPGNIDSPTIRVTGVSTGDTVEIFTDSICSVSVGSGVSSGSSIDITVSAIASDGSKTYWAETTDTASNSSGCSSASLTYELDATPPTVLGLSNNSVPTKSKTWTWSCSETCTYRYLIDNSTETNPSGAYGSITTDSISSVTGNYYIHVQAMDSAGNESAVAHVYAVLDNTPPLAPTVSFSTGTSSPSNDSTPSFDISNLVVGDTVDFFFNSICSGTPENTFAASSTTMTVTAMTIPYEQSFNYYAQSTDSAGNKSSCSSPSPNYLYDITNPSPAMGLDDGIATNDPTKTPPIYFYTYYDASGIALIEGRVKRTSDGFLMSGWIPFIEGTSITGLSLSAGTNYAVEVRITDGAGNMSVIASSDGFFIDTTAPTTSPTTLVLGTPPQYLDRTPTITFAGSTDPDSGISHYEIEIYLASDNSVVLPWSRFWAGNGNEHIFNGYLQNGTDYYLKVRGVNGSGLPGPASVASSNWTAGCLSMTLTTSSNTAYSISDGHYCFVVPSGISSLNIKAWGAGGGGSVGNGGGGGFTSGILSVSPGELLLITIGGGGEMGTLTYGGSPGYGGGGWGSDAIGSSSYNFGGGGGGYSAIFRGSTPLIIAGGGGGAHGDVGSHGGGAGGGLIGLDDSDPNGGKGGTQSSGGSGSFSCGEDGSLFKGGNAGIQFGSRWGGGGGGGGGYYGGGGGCRIIPETANQSTSGGGGSSYYDASVTSPSTIAGSGYFPANNSDPDLFSGGSPANTASGGSGEANGGPGRIFISW